MTVLLGVFLGAVAASQSVELAVSLEPALKTSAAYTRHLPLDEQLELRLGGGLALAPALLTTTQAARLQGIATLRWSAVAGFGAELTALPYFVHDAGLASTANGFGLEVRGAPGYFARAWSVALDLGYQATFVTHLRHNAIVTDAYGDRYPAGTSGEFDGPIDGWYGLSAQRLRAGLRAGWNIDAFELRLALGALWSVQRQGVFFGFNMGQVPVYAELGAAFAF